MRKTVDLVMAKKLREKGLTYKAIAEVLECSVVWCKENLKGTTKSAPEVQTVKELTNKAVSKDAVTSKEIFTETRKIYPNDFTKESMEQEEKHIRRIKDKIRTNEDSIIRPYWMVPDNSRAIFYSMMQTLQDRDEREQEEIDSIRAEHSLDESYSNSIGFALSSMSKFGSKLTKRSVVAEINRLSAIVDELEKRNVKPKKVKVPSKNLDFSDIDHLIY